MKFFRKNKNLFLSLLCLVFTSIAFAAGGVTTAVTGGGIGAIADSMSTTLSSIGKLMVAIAYVAGFGFLIFGILKFKQHKDNPTQVTLGTPVVMVLIGSVLVFVGAFVAPLGETFGVKDTDNSFNLPGADTKK